MLLNLLGLTALVSAALFAWKWGGFDERIAAFGFVASTVITKFATLNNYGNTEIGVLLVDAMLLCGLLILALRSDRFWPMWAAAFQLIGVTVHVASMTETGNFAWAYAVGLIFWSYPVLIALMAGTWLEARYRRT
nr:hypothetical protein [Polymorphobacter sp.]